MTSDSLADFSVRVCAGGARLERASFGALAGFGDHDHRLAVESFLVAAQAVANQAPPTRPAIAPGASFTAFCESVSRIARPANPRAAIDFLTSHFAPWRIAPANGAGFLTGYYEPEALGAWRRSAEFSAPVLARPAHIASDYPTRSEIETNFDRLGLRPIVWLRDWTEVFLIQVQGSARIRLPDGSSIRLAYDGRNGRPYTSIGRALIETGEIAQSAMSLARLKMWLRANGQEIGEKAREMMWRNQSFVFFKIDRDLQDDQGPTGGAGLPLVPLASIAIDRNIWPYGLPFWIEATLPWEGDEPSSFQRLMVGVDTGSAIIGAARADIFFGAGEHAGRMAGNIRHSANFVVLLPRAMEGADG